MSDAKSPIAKTEAYIAKHDLRTKITRGENGMPVIPEDIFETTAVMDAGVTLDQVKKLQKAGDQLFTAVTLIAGEHAVESFKENPNLTELGFSYSMGTTQKASGIFNRDSKDHVVVAIETIHRNAEFNRVAGQLNSMFNDINS